MKRFIEGIDRSQSTMFPERLEDWIGEDNAVRVVDVFVDELDLCGLGFGRVAPRATGRPSYHPSVRGCHVWTPPVMQPPRFTLTSPFCSDTAVYPWEPVLWCSIS